MGARVLQHVCCQQCNENLLQVSKESRRLQEISRLIHQPCNLPTNLPSYQATHRSIAAQSTSLNIAAWPHGTWFWLRQFLSLTRYTHHCMFSRKKERKKERSTLADRPRALRNMVLAASVSQPDKVHTSSNVTCILSCPWKTRARCPHVHKMDSLNSWMSWTLSSTPPVTHKLVSGSVWWSPQAIFQDRHLFASAKISVQAGAALKPYPILSFFLVTGVGGKFNKQQVGTLVAREGGLEEGV
eukprot:1161405-Pelagomonas_calceolata.AAC.2